VRAVQILPTKLLGVVVDHGDWPVERISIGGGTLGQLSIEPEGTTVEKQQQQQQPQKRWWVGSVGHDDTLRMTDLEGFFRDAEIGKGADDNDDEVPLGVVDDDPEDDESDNLQQPKKRKHKSKKDHSLNTKKKQKGNHVERSLTFFDDL